MRKVIIIILVIAFATAAVFYLGKGLFLVKFKSYLIKKIESFSGKGVRIEDIDYLPTKGLRLSGVKIYTDAYYARTLCSVSYLDIKLPVLRLLRDKILSPKITLHSLSIGNAIADGSFGFSMETGGKIKSVSFGGLSVKTSLLKIKNLTGSVDISPETIKTSGMRFTLGKENCKLSLDISNLSGKLSSKLEISSPNLNLNASIAKEDDTYKIRKINGEFFGSSFEFIGELESLRAPILSLYGKANIDIKDIAYFVPEGPGKSLDFLEPAGILAGSIYFKGNLNNPSDCEIGVKADAEYIKIWNFKFDNFHADMRFKDGVLFIPLINAYPYNGVFVSSFRADLEDNSMPYEANCKLSGINIAEMLKTTGLGENNLQGFLSSEFTLHGNAVSVSSIRGSGSIAVQDANLGPMPILTPLIGNLYGYLHQVFPELGQIDITRGSCNFVIADRKISTENLTLTGNAIGIYARGYMDFNKNLNFDVENELIKPESAAEADWQATVQGMLANFGKLISKSHLGGTLEKPKWNFQYMGGIKNVLKNGLEKVLKGVFSE